MSKMFSAVLLSVGIALAAGSASAQDGGSAEAGRAKAAACLGCHGPDGNSLADAWPKIAGQLPQYIAKQLLDFKTGRRSNDQMSPIVAALSDQDIRDLAAFYAAQDVNVAEGRAETLAQGERIYLKGAGRGPSTVTACVGCHGQSGEGNRDWSAVYARPPTVLAPAIGSQHPAYLVSQLQAYRAKTRSNDVGQVMRNIASRMSEDDINAVAQYVATLRR